MVTNEVKSDPSDEEKLGEEKETSSLLDLPLFKEFRTKAPGTHKHTQSLESMIENVCAAIDKDPTTLKLAARSHDLGKMWAAHLYSENQGKDNPHDGLPAWVSYQLLTRHVSDSIAIMSTNDFPKDVIRIVSQHHGNTVLQSIFEKAKAEDEGVSESMFRYKTNSPDSLESLILMLCDQVEATSRSIYVEQKIDVGPDVFVLNIYNKLHADGQFDNVELMLGKLKKVQEALISDVASNFQKRIAHEEDKDLVKEKAAE